MSLPEEGLPRWCFSCPSKPPGAFKPGSKRQRTYASTDALAGGPSMAAEMAAAELDTSTAVFDTDPGASGLDSPGALLRPPTMDLFASPMADADL